MTVTIKTTKKVETEVELEIEFPSFWKEGSSFVAAYSPDNVVKVYDLCAGYASIAKYSGEYAAENALRQIASFTRSTADEFNNALFQVTSNLTPITDKEVYELEQAEDELNINMELLEAMRSDVVNDVPIEIYEPSANATL